LPVTSGLNHISKWLALILGLIICAVLATQMTAAVQDRAASFAARQARADAKGMLRLLYDNPFMTGQARTGVYPAPRYHRPLSHEPYRDYPFAWRWLAALEVPAAGDYIFMVSAVDAVRLRVDGAPLVERWTPGFQRLHQAMLRLEKGLHLIDLQNVQMPRALELSLAWIPPGSQEARIIPQTALQPLKADTGLAEIADLYAARDSWRMLVWALPALWLILWLLVIRDPARALRAFSRHKAFWAILALAALTRLFWADVVHGIAGESAFFIWRAGLILEGAWPFQGMTTRTGPLFDYLLAVPLAIFGPSAWLHRIVGALPNILALVFLYRAGLREAGKACALAACLLLAVLPASVIFARMPGDNTSLGILFMCLGLDLLSASKQRPVLAVWAGLVWGLAFFNHSIFAILFITLGGAALVVSLGRIALKPQFYGFGLGVLIGFAPRIINRLMLKPEDVMSFTDPMRMLELPGFLYMFVRTLDGELAYRSFVGSCLWDTWLIIPLGYGLGVLYLIWRQFKNRPPDAWLELWLLAALSIHLILVPLGAPSANPRYYLYALVFTALLGGLAWGRAWQAWSPKLRPLLMLLLIGFAGFNLASLGVNYFYAHKTTGGQTGKWDTPLLDHTPDAWMNHSLLAAELAKRGYPVVATADKWHHTLHLALNLYHNQRPPKFVAVDIHSRSNTERAAVFYNSDEGRERMRFFLKGHGGHKQYREAKLPEPLASKYILLERTGPPVSYAPDVEPAP
jgi:hypothetical protein